MYAHVCMRVGEIEHRTKKEGPCVMNLSLL